MVMGTIVLDYLKLVSKFIWWDMEATLGASLRIFSSEPFIEPTKFLHTLYLKHWYNVQNLQNLCCAQLKEGGREINKQCMFSEISFWVSS